MIFNNSKMDCSMFNWFFDNNGSGSDSEDWQALGFETSGGGAMLDSNYIQIPIPVECIVVDEQLQMESSSTLHLQDASRNQVENSPYLLVMPQPTDSNNNHHSMVFNQTTTTISVPATAIQRGSVSSAAPQQMPDETYKKKKKGSKQPLYLKNVEDFKEDPHFQSRIIRAKKSKSYRASTELKLKDLRTENAELRKENQGLKEQIRKMASGIQ